MGDTDAIVVEGLTKTFRRQTAVDHVSFRVARGRFFGFLGPNGAGKSTTIRMLTGLLRPTAGDAVVEGVRLSGDLLALKRKIGVLTEELPLYERLTGEEHLLFAARMHGLARPEARRRTEELLEFLSLADERGKLVVDYSQGMRKKLALACALVHGPQVLFLDEPLNGIDPVSGRVVSDLLRRLTARGVTLFFTSHVLDVVERLCDEVAVIDRGQDRGPGHRSTRSGASGRWAGTPRLEDVFLQARPGRRAARGPLVDRLIALVALRWRLEARARPRLAGAPPGAPRRPPRAPPVLGRRRFRRVLARARSLERAQPELVLPAVSAVAALFGLTWALSPLLAGVAATETHDLGKLLTYPVPLPALVASSLVANLLQPTVLAQAPPLAALALGLGRGGARGRWPSPASPSPSPS